MAFPLDSSVKVTKTLISIVVDCQRTVNDIMQGLWVVLCPMLFAFTGSDINLVSSGIDLVTWCWMIFIVLLTIIVSIIIFYSMDVQSTRDYLGEAQLGCTLTKFCHKNQRKSICFTPSSQQCVPVLMWLAHSPACALIDREANYYCNFCAESGSHFRPLISPTATRRTHD